jgi:hypothetical protein
MKTVDSRSKDESLTFYEYKRKEITHLLPERGDGVGKNIFFMESVFPNPTKLGNKDREIDM